MDASYTARKHELLQECQSAPEMFAQGMPRWETFMAPFVESFQRQEPDQHAQTDVYGLLSDVARTNVASIAYRCGQDRLPLQRFMGWAPWDDAPLRQELRRQVAEQLGQPDGVLVCDPSGFAKSGHESVGGGPSMVRPTGQSGHLSGRPLSGIGGESGPSGGRYATVCAQRVDP